MTWSGTPRGRHRDRSLSLCPKPRAFGSATTRTPRPMLSCAAGLLACGSPLFDRLPRTNESQWHEVEQLAAHSCGGSRASDNRLSSSRSLLIPEGNRHREAIERSLSVSSRRAAL
jgi:hypothetical protein